MTLQEVQEKTTSTEFCEWKRYFEIEANAWHREDYYLAQIAAEVRRTIAKNPSDIAVENFLLTFETVAKEKAPLSEEEKARKLAASKAYWLNLPPPQKPKKKKG